MRIKVGMIEIDVEAEENVGDIKELSIRELLTMGVSLKLVDTSGVSLSNGHARVEHREKDYSNIIRLLIGQGLTSKTIVMISNRVLGYKIKGTRLEDDFGAIEKASLQFLNREITEEIWCVFAASVTLPHYGQRICTVGLTKQNQLVMLGLFEGKPLDAFKEIVTRGIKVEKVKLGILSFHLDAGDDFLKVFKKAEIGLDWQDLEDLTVGATAKLAVREAMLSKDKNGIKQVVKQLKAKPELLTFTQYPEKLWRVLRATTPIKRIEKSLKTKLNAKAITSDAEREIVLNWELIRLQYHWYKIPVDANQLSNLKFIAAQESHK